KKNSVDKKGTKPLDKEVKEEYKVIVESCKSIMTAFKRVVTDCENLNNKYSVIIKHHENKINNIKTPGTGILDKDPGVKEAVDELLIDVELSLAIIRDYKHIIKENEDLIKICKNQSLVHWRHLIKHL
ncbi:MAG: hypothetical protein KAX15_06055, partial [Candidatus Omnitrophica bacterium]|nr:hypothetical protein [Candidatus Omnitrophota bacterium]